MKWHFWLHPLRGIAAILVVLLHSYWTWSLYSYDAVRKLYLMVDFFFVLSGFVISSGYFEKIIDKKTLKSFFSRRFSRIELQYLLSGVTWLCAAVAFGLYDGVDNYIISTLRYILFMDFLFDDNVPRINPVAWSVMVEIWAYISFGFLVIIFNKSRKFSLIILTITLAFSIFLGLTYGDLNKVHGIAPVARAFTGFYMGALCYQAFYRSQNKVHLGAAILAQTLLAFAFGNYDLVSIPISAIIVSFVCSKPAPNDRKIQMFLSWIGDMSYPLYLWHFLLAVIMAKMINWIFEGKFIVVHGEKFVIVPPLYGDIFTIALVICSFAVAQGAVMLERHIRTGFRRLAEARALT